MHNVKQQKKREEDVFDLRGLGVDESAARKEDNQYCPPKLEKALGEQPIAIVHYLTLIKFYLALQKYCAWFELMGGGRQVEWFWYSQTQCHYLYLIWKSNILLDFDYIKITPALINSNQSQYFQNVK